MRNCLSVSVYCLRSIFVSFQKHSVKDRKIRLWLDQYWFAFASLPVHRLFPAFLISKKGRRAWGGGGRLLYDSIGYTIHFEGGLGPVGASDLR